MKIEALEAKYPHLKSEFPEMFIFLFKGGGDGELNDFGKMAEELYRLRRKPPGFKITEPGQQRPLDCVATDHCKADLRR